MGRRPTEQGPVVPDLRLNEKKLLFRVDFSLVCDILIFVMRDEHYDQVAEATCKMAGVEGVLQELARRDDYTNDELRSAMVRAAQDIHSARFQIKRNVWNGQASLLK